MTCVYTSDLHNYNLAMASIIIIPDNNNLYLYRTLAKIRPPFSARSLGLLGDWAFNRERRVFIRIYAHSRPQIEVYTLLYGNSVLIYCIFILIDSMNILLTTTML